MSCHCLGRSRRTWQFWPVRFPSPSGMSCPTKQNSSNYESDQLNLLSPSCKYSHLNFHSLINNNCLDAVHRAFNIHILKYRVVFVSLKLLRATITHILVMISCHIFNMLHCALVVVVVVVVFRISSYVNHAREAVNSFAQIVSYL